MDHVKLHKILSDTLENVLRNKIDRQEAMSIFRASRELISNSRNTLKAIEMGYAADVPLLGIKQLSHRSSTPKQRRIKG